MVSAIATTIRFRLSLTRRKPPAAGPAIRSSPRSCARRTARARPLTAFSRGGRPRPLSLQIWGAETLHQKWRRVQSRTSAQICTDLMLAGRGLGGESVRDKANFPHHSDRGVEAGVSCPDFGYRSPYFRGFRRSMRRPLPPPITMKTSSIHFGSGRRADTRNAAVFPAGVCHPTDKLALTGFEFMRRLDRGGRRDATTLRGPSARPLRRYAVPEV
jgi:hypothetical protein